MSFNIGDRVEANRYFRDVPVGSKGDIIGKDPRLNMVWKIRFDLNLDSIEHYHENYLDKIYDMKFKVVQK